MPLTRPLATIVAVSAVALAGMASLPRGREARGAPLFGRPHHERYAKVGEAGDESVESRIAAEQYAQARTAPGIVLPGAYSAAFASLSGLPVYGKSWTEVTNRPYDSDDPRYRDPFASNSSGGAGLVAGRITGLAGGDGYLYVRGADGTLWLATGEANTGATSYVGSGVYRLAKPRTGVFAATDRVGGSELES